ncbi:hypothetical protein Tco_1021753, partial [Tanacetum coccineum]
MARSGTDLKMAKLYVNDEGEACQVVVRGWRQRCFVRFGIVKCHHKSSKLARTELELTALQSGRSRSALVKDPEPPSVPPTKKQVDDLFQWFDDDEVVPLPPVVPITPVNVPAAPTPENANGLPVHEHETKDSLSFIKIR